MVVYPASSEVRDRRQRVDHGNRQVERLEISLILTGDYPDHVFDVSAGETLPVVDNRLGAALLLTVVPCAQKIESPASGCQP